jgi:hypothetical protein
MIKSKGLSLNYWVEAIRYENYIVNITPTNALNNIRSEETWNKIKVDLRHLCVFGSVAWDNIPNENMKYL